MNSLALAIPLAYAASILGVLMVAPQIVRIVRHPHLAGVSPWTWSITAVACSLWFVYGVRTASMPQIPGNVLLVSGAVAIVLLVPAAWSRPRRAVSLATVAALMVAASTRLAPEAVGFLAFGVGLFGVWPQVYETLWLRRGMGPSSLSLTSQLIKVVSQLLWLGYAVISHDLPVVVAATVTLTTNLAITATEASRRLAVSEDLEQIRVLEPA